MNMKKHIIIPLTFLTVLLTACETEIEYRGDEQDPLLVLNCIAEAGSTAYVDVSHSVFFLSSSEQMDMSLKDAVVTLDVNGKSATLAYDNEWGLYTDDRILNEGDRLKVTVTHPKYGTVTAEDVVPRAHSLSYTESTLPFSTSSTTSLTEETPGVFEYTRTDSVWRVALHIDDPVDEVNCYRLNLSVVSLGHVTPEGSNLWLLQDGATSYLDEDGMLPRTYDIYFGVPSSTQFALGISNDEVGFGIDMNVSTIYYNGSASFIFTDEYLGGGTANTSYLTFDIWMHTPFWWGDREGWYDRSKHTIDNYYMYNHEEEIDYGTPWDYLDPHFTYTITATLETITPAYYYYLKSSDKYESANWTLFAEPVSVYSNVEGGVGILGISSNKLTLTLEREFTFSIGRNK